MRVLDMCEEIGDAVISLLADVHRTYGWGVWVVIACFSIVAGILA